MRKSKELQLKLLQNYFKIEGKVATLNLVYDSFSELVNPNFGDDKTEKLNDKLFCDIKDAVMLLPRSYKLNLHIVIKDFGNYTNEECEKIIRQNVYLMGYKIIKDNNKKRATGWSLIVVGAIILLLSYLLRNFNLWFDLINISGTLFVWEGVYSAFIERNQENKEAIAVAKSIKNITIEGINFEKENNLKIKKNLTFKEKNIFEKENGFKEKNYFKEEKKEDLLKNNKGVKND